MSLLAELLAQGEEIQGASIASSSRAAYESVMRVYEAVMVDDIKEPAYPITVEKMIGF